MFDAVFTDEVHLVAFDGVEHKKEADSEAKSRYFSVSVLDFGSHIQAGFIPPDISAFACIHVAPDFSPGKKEPPLLMGFSAISYISTYYSGHNKSQSPSL